MGRLAPGRWALGAAIVVLAAGLLASTGRAELAVRLVDEGSGRELARVAVEDGATLRLSYVHSIYVQPAAEEFAVRSDGFELVGIASPSQAVLEYYARAEPIERVGDGYLIRVAGERHARLRVRASVLGRRTAHVGGRAFVLHEVAGDGAPVALEVASGLRFVPLRQPAAVIP